MDVAFDSNELSVSNVNEKSFESQTLKLGLTWTFKYFRRNAEAYVSWKFEWNEPEIEGFNGSITVNYVSRRKHSWTPITSSIHLDYTGQGVEVRIGTLDSTANVRCSTCLKYSFMLAPIIRKKVNLREYFKPSELTDVVLLVEREKVHVNKTFLSIHSEFFRAMFTSEFKEKTMKEIPIEDVVLEEFLELLAVIAPKPVLPTENCR